MEKKNFTETFPLIPYHQSWSHVFTRQLCFVHGNHPMAASSNGCHQSLWVIQTVTYRSLVNTEDRIIKIVYTFFFPFLILIDYIDRLKRVSYALGGFFKVCTPFWHTNCYLRNNIKPSSSWAYCIFPN